MKYLSMFFVVFSIAAPSIAASQDSKSEAQAEPEAADRTKFFMPEPEEGAVVPLNSPADWITQDDYPIEANREGRGGPVGFKATVGTNGLVSSCEISYSSGHADLDELTCKLVQRRARFKPAVDADGNDVEGVYTGTVRWRARRTELPEPLETKIELVIGVDGAISSCRILKAEGEDVADLSEEEVCAYLSTTTYTPPRDADGNPFIRTVVMSSKREIRDEVPQ